MKNIIIDIEDLAAILLVSNTPYFLYKHFYSHSSILKLSTDYSTAELKNFFSEEVSVEKTTLEAVATIYAIILALAKKPYNEVKQFFLDLSQKQLLWAPKIVEIYFSRNISESKTDFDANYRSNLLSMDYKNNSSTCINDYNYKPKITMGN